MPTPFCVVGTVATDPNLMTSESRVPFCTFRLASNERRFDREKNEWVDGETNWFTVNSFRTLAEHSKQSFNKGDRIVVNGRLRVRRWDAKDKSGLSVEIDADALGHDVRWGVSSFSKARTHAGGNVSDEPQPHESAAESSETQSTFESDPAAGPSGFGFSADAAA